jgi:hypothetical protein
MFFHRMFGLLVTFFGVGAMTCMSSGVAVAAVEHVVAGAQQRRRMRQLEKHPIQQQQHQQQQQQQQQQQRSLETTTDIPTSAPVIVEYWPTDPAPIPPTPRTPSHTSTTGSVHPSISIVPTVSMDTKGQHQQLPETDVGPIDVSNGRGNASSLSETNINKKPADESMTTLTSTTKEDVTRDSGAIQWTSNVESVAAGVTATAFMWSMWVVAFEIQFQSRVPKSGSLGRCIHVEYRLI